MICVCATQICILCVKIEYRLEYNAQPNIYFATMVGVVSVRTLCRCWQDGKCGVCACSEWVNQQNHFESVCLVWVPPAIVYSLILFHCVARQILRSDLTANDRCWSTQRTLSLQYRSSQPVPHTHTSSRYWK